MYSGVVNNESYKVPRRWNMEDNVRPFTLNSERRSHWSKRASLTKATRERFFWLAKEANIPKLDVVKIDVVPLVETRRQVADVAAHYPSAKAAIDGLVDAGIIPDDNDRHISRISFYASVEWEHDGLRIVVTEVNNKGESND